jgi:DNA gyrase/topoisomerase IV subunit A
MFILGILNDYFSVGLRRKDIKEKISELNEKKERLKREEIIIDLYKKKLASSKGKVDDKIREKIAQHIARELEDNLDDEILRHDVFMKISEAGEQVEVIIHERKVSEQVNKKETVVNLFLLHEKNKLFKAKALSAFFIIINLVMVATLNLPAWSLVIGCIIIFLIELKDQLLTFRVSKGYFGTSAYEAIQLLKFIRENSDKFDSDDDDGNPRRILNPKDTTKKSDNLFEKGWQNV